MEFRIHNGEYEDSLIITGETIEEIRKIALEEVEKRGWKNCWSEEIN